MIYFLSDYSLGAHPKVLEALSRTNMEHSDGYGEDEHCRNACRMIKELVGTEDCHVHMMIGGTPCNITTIAAALRPYEAVVALRSGHAYFHETGGVEATGHRITALEGVNGKMTPGLIDKAWEEFEDEHTPLPRLVYISQPTECGSVYSKAEMTAISEKCREKDMLLYVDGARLGTALTSTENDLSVKELARLCDAFYIGGTKNGALFGEALVLMDDRINDHFRYMIKRQGGLLAKGRLLGVQFEALLEGGENAVFFTMARHANEMAERMKKIFSDCGFDFYGESFTNQIFPIIPEKMAAELEKDFVFYRWAPAKDCMVPIRLVASWGTTEDEVNALEKAVRKFSEDN